MDPIKQTYSKPVCRQYW